MWLHSVILQHFSSGCFIVATLCVATCMYPPRILLMMKLFSFFMKPCCNLHINSIQELDKLYFCGYMLDMLPYCGYEFHQFSCNHNFYNTFHTSNQGLKICWVGTHVCFCIHHILKKLLYCGYIKIFHHITLSPLAVRI